MQRSYPLGKNMKKSINDDRIGALGDEQGDFDLFF